MIKRSFNPSFKVFHPQYSFFQWKSHLVWISRENMSEWKWNDVWSSMLTHTLNLCSAFNPFKCSHTVVNTHREHTPVAAGNQCCGAWGAVGGLVPCSRVSPQSWYWKRRERWLFTPPTDDSCQTWDSIPWPFSYKSTFLSIRPRLMKHSLCMKTVQNNSKQICQRIWMWEDNGGWTFFCYRERH